MRKKKIMKNISKSLIIAASAIMMCACTNDEAADNNMLPECKYPLEIGSVSIAGAEDSQTRLKESSDGMSSSFASGDQISVKIGEGTAGVYKYNGSSFDAVTPAYWQSKNNATVTAWYPTDKTIDISDQTMDLKYLLSATTSNVTYGSSASLSFSHKLAKLRVTVKDGTSSTKVTKVEVYNYQKCTNNEGSVTGNEPGWIAMRNNNGTWEANVVPTNSIPTNFIRINTKKNASVSGITKLEAGKVYSLTITKHVTGVVGVDLSSLTSDYTISDSKTYYFTGSGTHSIKVTSGSPNIYLGAATISTSGIGINITGGSPTIHAMGSDNTITSSSSAGIFVAEGSTVTITGSSRDDVLKVTGSSGSSSIGGYIINEISKKYANCGIIKISKITLYATGSKSENGTVSPGIGAASGASCQGINIEDATVYAYGGAISNQFSPAIGKGFPYNGSPSDSTPTVIIKNSTIHAHRGSGYTTDYIGCPSDSYGSVKGSSSINCGSGGGVYSSTVYCYTGSGNTVDKTATYDASGNITWI